MTIAKKRKQTILKSAWLITWGWAGRYAKPKGNKVVAILNYRKTGEYVRGLTEQFYGSRRYTELEMLECAFSDKKNCYPAQFVPINGVRFDGQIMCGANPYLHARLVRNLRFE